MRKSPLILVVFGGLLAGLGSGQQISPPPIEWQRVFGSYEMESLAAIQQTRDGGFLLAGSSSSPPGGNKTAPNYSNYDYWIVHLDAQGNQLWDHSFGGLRLDLLTSVEETIDGGLITGGISWSTNSGNKTTGHFGSYASDDFWVIRLDSSGSKIWEQNFGGTGVDPLRKVAQAVDGGFFLCGDSGSTNSGSKTATNYGTGRYLTSDYWVVKVDTNGQQLWDKSYGGNDDELAWCAQMTTDGGLILGGASRSGPSGNKTRANFGGYDFWVMRTDANGNKLWDAAFGGSNDDTMYCVAQMPDGGFMLGGRSDSPPSGNKTSPNYGNFDFWVVRLDATGNKLWEQSFGGTEDDFLYDINVTKDGGVILGGFSVSMPSGNKTAPNYGGSDFWVVRLDADGQKMWEASYGGSRSDEAKSVRQTSDGGFILGGTSASPADGNKTAPDFFFGDFWVLKLGPEQPYLRFSVPPFGAGGLRLSLTGIKNLSYCIEWSGNLTNWTSLQTNRMTNSVLEILDSSVSNSIQRFYRARQIQ
jgi:hypothetical protein